MGEVRVLKTICSDGLILHRDEKTDKEVISDLEVILPALAGVLPSACVRTLVVEVRVCSATLRGLSPKRTNPILKVLSGPLLSPLETHLDLVGQLFGTWPLRCQALHDFQHIMKCSNERVLPACFISERMIEIQRAGRYVHLLAPVGRVCSAVTTAHNLQHSRRCER